MKGLLGQVTIFSWQWHPWAHNTWPISVLFLIVCSKVLQNRFLQNVSALSPTVNTAHTQARKWAILAQWGSWISRLGLSPLNSYHRQGIFHKYFNGLNTAVNTITREWTISIMDCKCTVPQSTEQLFWLSPRSLLTLTITWTFISWILLYISAFFLSPFKRGMKWRGLHLWIFQTFSRSQPTKDIFRACSPSDTFSVISQYFSTACKRSPTFQSLSRSLLES